MLRPKPVQSCLRQPRGLRHQKNGGFTLVELMITVAILGIIAALAMAAYANYITTAQTTSLQNNFEAAVRTARTNYMTAENLTTLGANTDQVVPDQSSAWVDLLNRLPAKAPDGGPAYEAGTGNVTNGAVGIIFAGDYADNSSTLTVHRPAYNGLPAISVMVTQASL
ncbi:MAG: type II secretion system protein [Pseudomonadota bacterium]